MNNKKTFGAFLRKKRLESDISLRRFATMLKLSPVHMSNLENDRRAAPKDDILNDIAKFLLLNKEEKEEMYDLAANSKATTTVSSDLPNYIMTHELVRTALRIAKDVDASDDEWQEFINRLQKKGKDAKEDI